MDVFPRLGDGMSAFGSEEEDVIATDTVRNPDFQDQN